MIIDPSNPAPIINKAKYSGVADTRAKRIAKKLARAAEKERDGTVLRGEAVNVLLEGVVDEEALERGAFASYDPESISSESQELDTLEDEPERESLYEPPVTSAVTILPSITQMPQSDAAIVTQQVVPVDEIVDTVSSRVIEAIRSVQEESNKDRDTLCVKLQSVPEKIKLEYVGRFSGMSFGLTVLYCDVSEDSISFLTVSDLSVAVPPLTQGILTVRGEDYTVLYAGGTVRLGDYTLSLFVRTTGIQEEENIEGDK